MTGGSGAAAKTDRYRQDTGPIPRTALYLFTEVRVFSRCHTPDVPGKVHMVIGMAQSDLQSFLVQVTRRCAVLELLEFFNGFSQIASHNF